MELNHTANLTGTRTSGGRHPEPGTTPEEARWVHVVDGGRPPGMPGKKPPSHLRRLTAFRWLVLLGVAMLLLAGAGCGYGNAVGDAGPAPSDATGDEASTIGSTTGTSTGQTDGGTATTISNADQTTQLKIYLAKGEQLIPVRRLVPKTEAVGAATMKALLAGPTERERREGIGTVIPEGTAFLGLSIEGGVATVDLSREYGSGGGSLSMMMRIAQVVYTLTQFPTVDGVRFQLDGKLIEALGGEGLIVDHPVRRDEYESFAPPILVESPLPGEEVTSPLRITGTANVFEARVNLAVVDWDGLILAEKTISTSSGTGTRGSFDATLPFNLTRAGRGVLIASVRSPKDGSQQNVVEIPLELVR